MTIRTKVTLRFTALTTAILLVFTGVVYYAAAVNREAEFFRSLQSEAITKAVLFLSAEVDSSSLQKIYKSNRQIINEVEVAIYDRNFALLYHDAVEIDIVKETESLLQAIDRLQDTTFYIDDWQVIGTRFEFGGKIYLLTAAARDGSGYNKLFYLRTIILTLFGVSIAAIAITGYFFSKKTFSPVREIVEKATAISATNLHLRIALPSAKDDLSRMAEAFNTMLERLEEAFASQKSFVSNIAHEIRTPLMAIISDIDLALRATSATSESTGAVTEEELRATLERVQADARRLARLTTSLLDLAKADYHTGEIAFHECRLDELLSEVCVDIRRLHHSYKVHLQFAPSSDDDAPLTILANEYLLKVAFLNLIENACKFSDDSTCTVTIITQKEHIEVLFEDKGCGVSDDDLQHIFKPFFRGEQAGGKQGSGIGLALTHKIIALHRGDINISSALGSTIFSVKLPAK